MIDKEKEILSLSEQQKTYIGEIVEGSGGRIDNLTNDDGYLSYSDFMKIFSALIRLSAVFSKEKFPDFLAKRRDAYSKK